MAFDELLSLAATAVVLGAIAAALVPTATEAERAHGPRRPRSPAVSGSRLTRGRVKVADLVIVDGNPLADVTTLRRPLGVMVGGRFFGRDELSSPPPPPSPPN